MTEVIIGSRESKLAVLQSEMVKSYIEQKNREENAGSEKHHGKHLPQRSRRSKEIRMRRQLCCRSKHCRI